MFSWRFPYAYDVNRQLKCRWSQWVLFHFYSWQMKRNNNKNHKTWKKLAKRRRQHQWDSSTAIESNRMVRLKSISRMNGVTWNSYTTNISCWFAIQMKYEIRRWNQIIHLCKCSHRNNAAICLCIEIDANQMGGAHIEIDPFRVDFNWNDMQPEYVAIRLALTAINGII